MGEHQSRRPREIPLSRPAPSSRAHVANSFDYIDELTKAVKASRACMGNKMTRLLPDFEVTVVALSESPLLGMYNC